MSLIHIFSSLLRIIKQTFYSKEFYLDVINKWNGSGQKYFLTISSIASIPLVFITILLLSKTADTLGAILNIHENKIVSNEVEEYEIAKKIHDVIVQIPDINIENYNFKMNDDKQLIIKAYDGSDLIYINTSEVEVPNEAYPLVILKDKLFIYGTMYDMNFVENLIGPGRYVNSPMSLVTKLHDVLISSFLSFCLMSIILNFYFIYSKFFLIFMLIAVSCMIIRVKLNFQQLSRVTSFVLTPAITISTIIYTITLILSFSNLTFVGLLAVNEQVFNLINLGYFVYLISLIKKNKNFIGVNSVT